MQVIQTLMKKKKGRDNIMHEVAILAIWFSFTIAGMILTILMPHIFPDSPGKMESRISWCACLRKTAYKDTELRSVELEKQRKCQPA